MPRVDSSAIRRVSYDENANLLTVTFTQTGTYTYFGVPPFRYEQFLQAESKGSYFNRHIKDRYAFARHGLGLVKPH